MENPQISHEPTQDTEKLQIIPESKEGLNNLIDGIISDRSEMVKQALSVPILQEVIGGTRPTKHMALNLVYGIPPEAKPYSASRYNPHYIKEAEPQLDDPQKVADILRSINTWQLNMRELSADFLQSLEVQPYIEELSRTIAFLRGEESRSSALQFRPLNVIEFETARNNQAAAMYGRPVNSRFQDIVINTPNAVTEEITETSSDNEATFPGSVLDVMKRATRRASFAEIKDKPKDLSIPHEKSLLRMEQEITEKIFRKLILSEVPIFLRDDRDRTAAETPQKITPNDLHKLSFVYDSISESDEKSFFLDLFHVMYNGKKMRVFAEAQFTPGDTEFQPTRMNGFAIESLVTNRTFLNIIGKNAANLPLAIELAQTLRLAKHTAALREQLYKFKKSTVFDHPQVDAVEKWLNNADSEHPILEKKTLLSQDVAYWLFIQIAEGKTEITVDELLYYLKKKSVSQKEIQDSLLLGEPPKLRTIFDSPFEEYESQVDMKTFEINGPEEKIKKIDRLVFYSGQPVDWQIQKIEESGEDEHEGVTVHALISTKISEGEISVNGERKKYAIIPLGTPPHIPVKDITLFDKNKRRLSVFQGREFNLGYDPISGTSIAFMENDTVLLHVGREVTYTMVLDEVHSDEPSPIDYLDIDRNKLEITAQRLEIAKLPQFAQALTELLESPKESLNTTDLKTAIMNKLQATIVGPNHQVPTLPQEVRWATGIHEAVLGIDPDTQKIRVQCTHAAQIADILLRELLPDATLEKMRIYKESLVRVKVVEKDKIITGEGHADVRIEGENNYLFFDVTPTITDDILQRELQSDRKTTKSNEALILEKLSAEDRKTLFRTELETLYKNILETTQYEIPIASMDDIMHLNPKIGIMPKVINVLAYLASEGDHPEIAMNECRKILQDIVSLGVSLQEKEPQKREKLMQLLEQGEPIHGHIRDVFRVASITSEILG